MLSFDQRLRWVRILHTFVWLIFASSILLIPALSYLREYRSAACLIGFVFLEVLVLATNGMKCPLTDAASRYTYDRRDNFDIYLPLWLARHNKTIFGTLYVGGIVYTVLRSSGVLR